MVFNIFEGLDDGYRSYNLVSPDKLNYRPSQNDSERMTAAALSKEMGRDSATLFISGGVIAAIGIAATFSSLGGIIVILFGLVVFSLGFVKLKQSKAEKLVATGVLLKKESMTSGTVSNHTKHTHLVLVIEVDGMERTLSTVNCTPENYEEARVGDRILVIDNPAVHFGKKMM